MTTTSNTHAVDDPCDDITTTEDWYRWLYTTES